MDIFDGGSESIVAEDQTFRSNGVNRKALLSWLLISRSSPQRVRGRDACVACSRARTPSCRGYGRTRWRAAVCGYARGGLLPLPQRLDLGDALAAAELVSSISSATNLAIISSLTPLALICRAISSYYDPIIGRFLAIGKVTVRYRLDSSGR